MRPVARAAVAHFQHEQGSNERDADDLPVAERIPRLRVKDDYVGRKPPDDERYRSQQQTPERNKRSAWRDEAKHGENPARAGKRS